MTDKPKLIACSCLPGAVDGECPTHGTRTVEVEIAVAVDSEGLVYALATGHSFDGCIWAARRMVGPAATSYRVPVTLPIPSAEPINIPPEDVRVEPAPGGEGGEAG